MLNLQQIIKKTAAKVPLSKEEINFFVDKIINTDENIDCFIASWLMAIYLNGLTVSETAYLTDAIVKSGKIIDLNDVQGPIIDKHSTGGVGDKVSIIIVPILTALGIKVAKISGRGLGYTGGTVDKLESIGVNLSINDKQANLNIKKEGCFVMQQTSDIAPVDKILYSIRDVTGMVNSIPLVTSSILSKKFCISNTDIFLDIKTGSGAVFQNEKDVKKLIKMMLAVSTKLERKLTILLTAMDKPLGRAVGNIIEVKESIEFLKDYKSTSEDLQNVICGIITNILVNTKKAQNINEAKKMYNDIMATEKPYSKFKSWIASQGADVKVLSKVDLFSPKYKFEVKAQQQGYVDYISTRVIGEISVLLGAGRIQRNDKIDFQAGIYLNKKDGEYVNVDDIIATFYSSKPIDKKLVVQFQKNTNYSKKKIKAEEAIKNIYSN